MKTNLLNWSAAIGAFPRIMEYREKLSCAGSYFDRLRIVNEALGPHWIFRLADAVGLDTIKANRLSWYRFYIEDVDRLHCPLDPGAPETEAYLGRQYADMDMGFYAGMGFDGYRLALQKSRHVSLEDKTIEFDGRYHLVLSASMKNSLCAYDVDRFVPKEDYYSSYSDTLTNLYDLIGAIVRDGHTADEDMIERAAAGCLILLCGGHRGCSSHINNEERFSAQMESMIIFAHARRIILGQVSLGEPNLAIVKDAVA